MNKSSSAAEIFKGLGRTLAIGVPITMASSALGTMGVDALRRRRLKREAADDREMYLMSKDRVLRENNLDSSGFISHHLDTVNSYAPTITQNPYILNSIADEIKRKKGLDVETHNRIANIEKNVSDSQRHLSSKGRPSFGEDLLRSAQTQLSGNMIDSIQRGYAEEDEVLDKERSRKETLTRELRKREQNLAKAQDILNKREGYVKELNRLKQGGELNKSASQLVMEKKALSYGSAIGKFFGRKKSLIPKELLVPLAGVGVGAGSVAASHIIGRRQQEKMDAAANVAFNKAMENLRELQGESDQDELGGMDFSDKKTWETSRSYFESLKRTSPELATDPTVVTGFLKKTVPHKELDVSQLKAYSDIAKNVSQSRKIDRPFVEGFQSSIGKTLGGGAVEQAGRSLTRQVG